MNICLYLILISVVTSLSGEIIQPPKLDVVKKTQPEFKPNSKNIRIKSLWPEFMAAKMGIEPAIPDNFILLNDPRGDVNSRFFWGPKDIDISCFQNHSSLKAPLLKFWLSHGISQTSATTFSNTEAIESDLKNDGFKNIVITKSMWGTYPVLSFKGQKDAHFHAMAWIGLNHESATTLCASLVYPDRTGKPTNEDIHLWNTFIKNTTQLPHPEFFIAMGQDLQPGYTIVDLVSETVTFIAEKRTRDNTIQLVCFPNGPDIKFTLDSFEEVLMGSEWNYNKPLLKVYGSLSQTKNEATFEWMNMAISILLKPVEEFSITKEWMESHSEATSYEYQMP